MNNQDKSKKREKVEKFNVIDFLKELDLDVDTKRKLLGCISVMMAEAANRATMFAVAACVGLDTEDPKFAALWNELDPIIELDPNKLFDDLREDILGEKDGENINVRSKC